MNAKKIAINFDNSNDHSKGLKGGSKADQQIHIPIFQYFLNDMDFDIYRR